MPTKSKLRLNLPRPFLEGGDIAHVELEEMPLGGLVLEEDEERDQEEASGVPGAYPVPHAQDGAAN